MDEHEEPVEEQAEAPESSSKSLWIASAVLLVAGAGGAFWFFKTQGGLRPPPSPDPTAAAPVETRADAGAVELEAPAVPALAPEDGDTLLRRLVAGASSSPQLLSWVESGGILQRVAAAVRLVADGRSPRAVLGFIEGVGDFTVREEITRIVPVKAGDPNARADYSERDFMTPASWARYDQLTRVVTSVNAVALGKAYGQLRPHFDSAFAQVARPGERFDDVLTKALRRLVSVRFPQGPIELVPKGAIYLYKDPALESLGAAEKHLLRTGPDNTAAIQATLVRFAESAGLSL